MKRFFDDYPLFYATGISATPNRLQARYEAIVEWNKPWLSGAVVLDLASHDGRWSFAALRGGGAVRAVGIEPRERFVRAANANMVSYGYSRDQFSVWMADANQAIAQFQPGDVDVIFCCGFLYHAHNPLSLLESCVALRPKLLVIDTEIEPLIGPVCVLREERTATPGSAAFGCSAGPVDRALVQRPTRDWIAMVFKHLGQPLEEYPWKRDREDWTDLEEYKMGTRSTYRVLLPGSQVT